MVIIFEQVRWEVVWSASYCCLSVCELLAVRVSLHSRLSSGAADLSEEKKKKCGKKI